MAKLGEVFNSAIGFVNTGLEALSPLQMDSYQGGELIIKLPPMSEIESRLYSTRAAYESALNMQYDPNVATHLDRILGAAKANFDKAVELAMLAGLNPNGSFETSTAFTVDQIALRTDLIVNPKSGQ